MYRSLLIFSPKCGAYLRAALKTIVIPLSTVFMRISAALIKFPKCNAYLSNYCNLQLKSLLYLGHREYYMAARRYEISLQVLRNISQVSAANEWNIFFQHEKRNLVSPSDHVIFYLLYKHQWNAKPFYLNSFLVWKVRFIMKP